MKKTVIITGANGNLGAACVEKFIESGFQVVGVDNAPSNSAYAGNPALDAHIVNLLDEKETAEFVNQVITKHKRIDAALLLVGGFAMGGIAETSLTDIQKMISLNFETAYNSVRPVFNQMMKQEKGGRIVLVGARPAIEVTAGKMMVAYSLSKSLVFELSNILNAIAKGTNVVTTVIVPSTLDTPANRKSMPNANFHDWVNTNDLAEILEFICSPAAGGLRETVLKVYNNA